MKTITIVIVTLIIGFFYGSSHAERALEGCGHAANTVNNMLSNCEWDYAQCQISLIDAQSNYQQIMKASFPNRFK